MQLYYFESPNPRLACVVARHVGAPVDYVRVDLARGEHRRPDYLAINPNGKVPTLVDDRTVLWEAPAIACHLASRAGSDLWPREAGSQAEIIRWINWSTAHFSRHAGSLFFERVIKPALGLGAPDVAAMEEATRYFIQYATVLDDVLRSRGHLVGDRLSVADLTVATFLPVAEPSGLPLAGFDQIRRWYRQIEELPAWREPFPASGMTEADSHSTPVAA